jgi:hypothetical protein
MKALKVRGHGGILEQEQNHRAEAEVGPALAGGAFSAPDHRLPGSVKKVLTIPCRNSWAWREDAQFIYAGGLSCVGERWGTPC